MYLRSTDTRYVKTAMIYWKKLKNHGVPNAVFHWLKVLKSVQDVRQAVIRLFQIFLFIITMIGE